MDLDKTLNLLLVNLYKDIMEIEQKSLITEEFSDATVNDMHVIESIGMGDPQTSSAVSKKLSITMGTLTKAVDGLTSKGYVIRVRSEEDKRVVLLSLTEKGKKAYLHHAKFHKDMVDAVMAQLDEGERDILNKSLNGLMEYLKK